MRQYEKAIADYSEAIRIDPKDSTAYQYRGVAWRDKKEPVKALADFDAAIRLEPKGSGAHYGRAVILFLMRRDGVSDAVKTVLDLEGWRQDVSLYAVLLGHFSARRDGQTEKAKKLLDEGAARCDASAWAYSIVRYLRGEIDERKLLTVATDDDRMTELRGYLGLDALQKGQVQAALAHFRWVKEHGNPSYGLYAIALAELERIDKK